MFVAVRDGILTWAGFEDMFSGLASLGVRSLELAVSREPADRSKEAALPTPLGFDVSTDDGKAALRQVLRAKDVSVCAILLDNDFAREDLDAEVRYVVEACEADHELGVNVARINAVMREIPGLSVPGHQKRAVKGIAACLEQLEGLGVSLAIENHGVICNRVGFLLRLLEEVDSEWLGLTLDTGNFYWYGYPLEDIQDIVYGFGPFVKHTHIKNACVPDGQKERKRKPGEVMMAPLYEGDIDLRVVVGNLRDAGYDCDLTIEDESLGRFTPEQRRQVLRKDAEFMKSLLA